MVLRQAPPRSRVRTASTRFLRPRLLVPASARLALFPGTAKESGPSCLPPFPICYRDLVGERTIQIHAKPVKPSERRHRTRGAVRETSRCGITSNRAFSRTSISLTRSFIHASSACESSISACISRADGTRIPARRSARFTSILTRSRAGVRLARDCATDAAVEVDALDAEAVERHAKELAKKAGSSTSP